MAIIAMPIADLKRARETAQNTSQNTSTVAPTQAVAQTKPATATPPRAIKMRPAQQGGGTDIRRTITMIMSLMGSIIGLYTVVYAMQIIYSVPPAQLVGTPVAFSLG